MSAHQPRYCEPNDHSWARSTRCLRFVGRLKLRWGSSFEPCLRDTEARLARSLVREGKLRLFCRRLAGPSVRELRVGGWVSWKCTGDAALRCSVAGRAWHRGTSFVVHDHPPAHPYPPNWLTVYDTSSDDWQAFFQRTRTKKRTQSSGSDNCMMETSFVMLLMTCWSYWVDRWRR